MKSLLTRRRALVIACTGVPALGLALVVAPGSGAQAAEVTRVFDTPATTTFEVPADVACLTLEVAGAQGGDGAAFGLGDVEGSTTISPGGAGGFGGIATATVAVTPGSSIQIVVGGAGEDGAPGDGGRGGENGGADGGFGKGSGGGGGGGASDVRIGGTSLGDRVIVGGGGGGGGAGGPALPSDDVDVAPVEGDEVYPTPEAEGAVTDNPGGDGGGGGGDTGGDGADGFNVVGETGGTGGGGGTQTAGGTAGANSTNVTGTPANPGAFGDGGEGGSSGDGGGGGGGGWFGGGGGGAGFDGTGAGGGGGSGHGPADVTYVEDAQQGNGAVIITYTPGDTSCGGVLPDDTEPLPDVIAGDPAFTG
jgi:hypothetical protein